MTERKMQLEDWLDDLCVRFIINLPEDDLSSVPRICFQVEEAQWYYEDFIRPLDPTLPSLSLRSFCLRIFAHCPLLSAFSQGDHMRAFEEFLLYKTRVPVRGAIMLNEAMDSAVLVKGWKNGANWSFPRGKINKDEDDLTCAIREVYEETGYDIENAGLVPQNREVKSIDINMREQQMRLYVFRGVPMDTHFEPRTRKEISKIQWWRLSELPAFRRKGQQQPPEAAVNANKFYMVAPFLVPLRKWVVEQKKKDSKRVLSNQYLSAGMSHDEGLTEEDQGAELYAKDPQNASTSVPELDTLEGATAALSLLLKIQPPTQGLQAEAISAGQSPAAMNSGEALLALLHGNARTTNQPTNPALYPSMEHSIPHPPIPMNQYHEPPRSLHPSILPPPPTIPVPQDVHYHYHPNNMAWFHQNHITSQQQPLRLQEHHNSYQPQHLVHPQPLPPHVQKALFADGPRDSPVSPHPIDQQSAALLDSKISLSAHSQQFPNLHLPMSTTLSKPTPPKLTSHSLALLNAFKSRDQANVDATTSNDLPMARYTQEDKTRQPQELHAETSMPAHGAIPSEHDMQQKSTHALSPNMLTSRPPISELHRSTLLDLFKSPAAQATNLPSPLAATALPTSMAPSAVELSAVENLSANVAPPSTILNERRAADQMGEKAAIPVLSPESNLQFRPVSILARPPQSGDLDVRTSNAFQSNGDKHVARASGKIQSKQPPGKPFQPQILKRPQPNTLNASGSGPSSSFTFNPLPVRPSFDSRGGNSTEHKQTLLSLFGKSPSATNPLLMNSTVSPLVPLNTIDLATSAVARSRVGSLASGVESGPTRRGSQIPISPADKGFLLDYLDAVGKGTQR